MKTASSAFERAQGLTAPGRPPAVWPVRAVWPVFFSGAWARHGPWARARMAILLWGQAWVRGGSGAGTDGPMQTQAQKGTALVSAGVWGFRVWGSGLNRVKNPKSLVSAAWELAGHDSMALIRPNHTIAHVQCWTWKRRSWRRSWWQRQRAAGDGAGRQPRFMPATTPCSAPLPIGATLLSDFNKPLTPGPVPHLPH